VIDSEGFPAHFAASNTSCASRRGWLIRYCIRPRLGFFIVVYLHMFAAAVRSYKKRGTALAGRVLVYLALMRKLFSLRAAWGNMSYWAHRSS